MEVAIVVLFLGVLIFLGNVFNRVFALTKIPDLLILIGIGILIGPVLGLVSPTEYGIIGPLFATVTLAVILFEGGLHLKMATIRSAFRGTIELTLISFVVTMLISAGILIFLNLLEPLPALMLGAAIGGTSSAVVIPMIEYLHLGKDSQAILALESAITDVLCIVLLLTLLDIYIIGETECSLCWITARFIVLYRGDPRCYRWDFVVGPLPAPQNYKKYLPDSCVPLYHLRGRYPARIFRGNCRTGLRYYPRESALI